VSECDFSRTSHNGKTQTLKSRRWSSGPRRNFPVNEIKTLRLDKLPHNTFTQADTWFRS